MIGSMIASTPPSDGQTHACTQADNGWRVAYCPRHVHAHAQGARGRELCHGTPISPYMLECGHQPVQVGG